MVVLGRIAAAMGAGGGFPGGLDRALDALREGVQADACELFLLDSSAGEMLLTGLSARDEDAFCTHERFDLGSGYPGIVAGQRRTLTTQDLARDIRYLRRQVPARGYQSYVCAPLIRGDRVLGTVHLAWKRKDPEFKRAVQMLFWAGVPLGAALVADYADLAGQARTIGVGDAQLQALAGRFCEAGGGDSATIAVRHGSDRELVYGSSGDCHIRCDLMTRQGKCTRPDALSAGRCVVLRGQRRDWPGPCRTLPGGFRSYVGVPLHTGGREVSFAYVAYESDLGRPSTRHFANLLALAREVGPMLGRLAAASSMAIVEAPVPTIEPIGPRLQLNCFGPFEVFLDGRRVSQQAFSRAKAVELLKILTLRPGRPTSRDALIEWLWPNAEPESAVSRLHVTMHALRKVIEPKTTGRRWLHILNRGGGFFLDRDSPYSTDIDEFRALLEQARMATADRRPSNEVAVLLERAVALYRGDLFADDDRSDWILAEREAFRGLYLDALIRLARHHCGAAAWDRVITLLNKALEVDPLREDVHQLLIHSQWSAGRREGARRSYERCVWLLREELAAEPLPETRRLGMQVGARELQISD
jgi:DNA-binding SARP family transcriptional activator